MTQSAQMRRLIDMMAMDDVVFCLTACPRIPLMESMLTEAKVMDLVKASAAKIKDRYDDVKYSLLARVTNKALDIFGRGSAQTDLFSAPQTEVQKTLKRIAKVGKFAVQNRALMVALIGMVSVLVGLSHNPSAAAQASAKLNNTLDGSVDDIINRLSQSGIQVHGVAHGDYGTLAHVLDALPPDVQHSVEKVAKALRAIEHYKFHGDSVSTETSASLDAHIDGTIEKVGQTFSNHIKITTLDGQITLSELTIKMVNGKIQDDFSGVSPDLNNILNKITKLSPDQQQDISNYITRGNEGSQEFIPSNSNNYVPEVVENIIKQKAPEISSAFGALVSSRPDGVYKVKMDRGGPTIVSEAPDAAANPAGRVNDPRQPDMFDPASKSTNDAKTGPAGNTPAPTPGNPSVADQEAETAVKQKMANIAPLANDSRPVPDFEAKADRLEAQVEKVPSIASRVRNLIAYGKQNPAQQRYIFAALTAVTAAAAGYSGGTPAAGAATLGLTMADRMIRNRKTKAQPTETAAQPEQPGAATAAQPANAAVPSSGRTGFRDTVGTTGRSWGNRLKNAAMATLGSNSAHGQLAVRIMADDMMKRWLRYQGATQDLSNPDNIFQFLSRSYPGVIDPGRLRSIIQSGGQPPTQPNSNPPPPAPQKPAAGDEAGRIDDPQQAEMNLTGTAPSQPVPQPAQQPAQNAAGSPPPPQPAAAPTASPPPSTASTAGSTEQPSATKSPQIRTVADIMAQDRVSARKAAQIQDQEIAARQPSQSTNATPATPAPASPQPGQTTEPPPASVATTVQRSVLNMLQQAQTNPQDVMGAILNGLKQAAPGSPERAKIVQTIAALKNNPAAVAKVPALQQLTVESLRMLHKQMLREAAELNRRALDAIFIGVARELVRATGGTSTGSAQSAQNTTAFGEQSRQPTAADLTSRGDGRIRMSILQAVMRSQPPANKMQAAMLNKMIQASPNETVAIRDLLNSLRTENRLRPEQLDSSIINALVTAMQQTG